MYTIDLKGKNAVIFGIANQRSIAWAITQFLSEAGANIIAMYQNERVAASVQKLTSTLPNVQTIECDVSSEPNVEKAFSQIDDIADQIDDLVKIGEDYGVFMNAKYTSKTLKKIQKLWKSL